MRALKVTFVALICAYAMFTTTVVLRHWRDRPSLPAGMESATGAVRPGSPAAAQLAERDATIEVLEARTNALDAQVTQLAAELEAQRSRAADGNRETGLRRASGRARLAAAEAASWLARLFPDQFAQASPEEIRYLRELDLSDAEITDADLLHIQALESLTTLKLAGTAVTDAGLANLGDLDRLLHLDLAKTEITGAGLESLGGPNLQYLKLAQTRLQDEDLHLLADFECLKVVKLNHMEITDAGMYGLATSPSLRHIEIDSTRVTDVGLAQLVAGNPALERIEVRSTAVTADGARRVVKDHPHLNVVLQQGSPGFVWQAQGNSN